MKQFDVFLDDKVTKHQFDVFLEDKATRCQFDILLNQNMTESDLVIHSLPYRETFAAIDDLILSQQADFILHKIIAANNIQELIANVSGLIKQYPEEFKQDIEIVSNVETSETQYIRPNRGILEILDNIDVLPQRWRLLSDMDNCTLAEFDAITLKELNYIPID